MSGSSKQPYFRSQIGVPRHERAIGDPDAFRAGPDHRECFDESYYAEAEE